MVCFPGEMSLGVGDGALARVELDADAGERPLAPGPHRALEERRRRLLDLEGELVAVDDLHCRRPVVDLGRLEDELLGGGHGGGVEGGPG
jgi:hypothetical protein